MSNIVWATTYGNALLDWLVNQTTMPAAPTTPYLSLHTAAPGLTGANEVTDATYARQDITACFPAAGSKAVTNSSAGILFPAATADYHPTHWGIWSAVTTGTFYCGDAFATDPGTVAAGNQLQISASDFDLTAP